MPYWFFSPENATTTGRISSTFSGQDVCIERLVQGSIVLGRLARCKVHAAVADEVAALKMHVDFMLSSLCESIIAYSDGLLSGVFFVVGGLCFVERWWVFGSRWLVC